MSSASPSLWETRFSVRTRRAQCLSQQLIQYSTVLPLWSHFVSTCPSFYIILSFSSSLHFPPIIFGSYYLHKINHLLHIPHCNVIQLKVCRKFLQHKILRLQRIKKFTAITKFNQNSFRRSNILTNRVCSFSPSSDDRSSKGSRRMKTFYATKLPSSMQENPCFYYELTLYI